jgi:hypothetical protein
MSSIEEVNAAVRRLIGSGVSHQNINVLTPGSLDEESDVPTSETEQPGMGRALGGVVGGALGMFSGLSLGATASLLVPGIGPVLAAGAIGAAVLGIAGAVGGAVLGDDLEKSMDQGLPVNELFVYEHALREGRSVIIVFAEGEQQAQRVREILMESGAESVDAARDKWWVGLRETEEAYYDVSEQDFKIAEPQYRQGFETAQHPRARGRSYDRAIEFLKDKCPQEIYTSTAFRRGYERGQAYRTGLLEKPENKVRKKFRHSGQPGG